MKHSLFMDNLILRKLIFENFGLIIILFHY